MDDSIYPHATQEDIEETLLQVAQTPNIKYADCFFRTYPDNPEYPFRDVKIHIAFTGDMPQWKVPKERMKIFLPPEDIKAKEIVSGVSRRRLGFSIPYADKRPLENRKYIVVDRLDDAERAEIVAEGYVNRQW